MICNPGIEGSVGADIDAPFRAVVDAPGEFPVLVADSNRFNNVAIGDNASRVDGRKGRCDLPIRREMVQGAREWSPAARSGQDTAMMLPDEGLDTVQRSFMGRAAVFGSKPAVLGCLPDRKPTLTMFGRHAMSGGVRPVVR
jgi:hypothetical protein